MIIGARLAGVFVSRTTDIVSVLRITVSSVITANINLSKVSSAKNNSRRMSKDRDIQSSVSMKAIQRELHAANIQGRVSIPKTLVSAWNAMKRLR
ncbi:hypothetical protein TNCV_3997551 [Trichonephila clavipes]|nr:hypothetical protein TNCV_3997551 [Trichonephila clavipes]